MADDADIASDYAERLNQEQLEARVRFEGESETYCIDCDEEIPERRRASLPGVLRCVDCQSIAERS